ncbi:hypothetical protein C5E45_12880 [Nocardia nova]|uniref:Uncharacterized protein n=1 Tax=Nocardia nova TaxID=37330 RepID=A0A2S6AQU4_9NOCA|nr:hypothetical protein C5E45_12880 [Nocardia nova]
MLAGQLDANAVDERTAQIAEFVNSGVHQSYPFYVVGPDGETALSWLRATGGSDRQVRWVCGKRPIVVRWRSSVRTGRSEV